MDAEDRRCAIGLSALFFVLGVAFVAMVPRGLPYDEPSHFYCVRFNSELRGLPVVLNPAGQSYEACQPPLYYVVFGLLYRVLGTGAVGFYGCRLVTLAISTPLVYLTYQLTREFSGERMVARWAALLVAINPAMLGIAGSIQNDSLSIVFSMVGSWLAIRWCWTGTMTAGRMALVSVFVTAAILTKSSAMSVIPFVGLVFCVMDRKRAIQWVGILVVVMIAGSGWWFLRNHQLYGDYSGANSVKAVFASGGKFDPFSPRAWVWVGRSFLTYYTTPVTYWRDEIKNPVWFTIAIGFGALCVVIGLVISAARTRLSETASQLKAWCVVFTLMAIGLWLWISFRNFAVAARVAMPALAATMLIVAGALCDLRSVIAKYAGAVGKYAILLPVIIFLAGDANLLIKASRLHHRPYEISLSAPLP
jgi:hypothetical protein